MLLISFASVLQGYKNPPSCLIPGVALTYTRRAVTRHADDCLVAVTVANWLYHASGIAGRNSKISYGSVALLCCVIVLNVNVEASEVSDVAVLV